MASAQDLIKIKKYNERVFKNIYNLIVELISDKDKMMRLIRKDLKQTIFTEQIALTITRNSLEKLAEFVEIEVGSMPITLKSLNRNGLIKTTKTLDNEAYTVFHNSKLVIDRLQGIMSQVKLKTGVLRLIKQILAYATRINKTTMKLRQTLKQIKSI